jgi:Uma2 family endonuclease
MSVADQLPAAMTVAEFLDWNPQDGDRWELIDGTPQAMALASPRHGAIQNEAGRMIGNHLADSRPACRVITEPGIHQPKVRANRNVRVPDLAVTCAEWDPDERLLQNLVVVVEILSPSNKADTWANVWSYVTIPSVLEILVLHTARPRGSVAPRTGRRLAGQPSAIGIGDTVTLESVGFTTPRVAFYRTA